MPINKICVIGGGVVETDGQYFYLKNQVAEYLEGLSDLFEEVHFLTRLQENRSYISRVDNKRIRITVLGKTRTNTRIRDVLTDGQAYWRILPKIIDRQTGVILSNLSPAALFQVILCRMLSGIVVYYVGSDPLLTEKLKKKNLLGLVKRITLRMLFPLTAGLCHGVLARGQAVEYQCGKWNRNVILSHPLISYQKIRIHVNQVSGPRISGPLEFLYVGKLDENKGVNLLIEAFIRLWKYNQQIRLTIVGDGARKEELAQRIPTEIGKSAVIFTGYIDDPARLIAFYLNADVLVIPSVFNEGFPRVIDEAMALGIPVICSRIAGMASGLRDDEVMFVTPGDEEDLYNTIKIFSEDIMLRKRLHEKALAKSRSILDETAAVQHAKYLLGIAP